MVAREPIPDRDGGRIPCRQGILQGCFAERCATGPFAWHFMALP
jgi:hypothetical protein